MAAAPALRLKVETQLVYGACIIRYLLYILVVFVRAGNKEMVWEAGDREPRPSTVRGSGKTARDDPRARVLALPAGLHGSLDIRWFKPYPASQGTHQIRCVESSGIPVHVQVDTF